MAKKGIAMVKKLDELLKKSKKTPALEVALRKAEKRDVAVLSKWMHQDDFQFLLSTPRQSTLKQTKNSLLQQISLNTLLFPTKQTLIVESASGIPLGFITLARIDWRNRTLALESYFDQKYRETPYPISAGVKVFAYIFQELNMQKVYSFVHGYNQNSLKIHEKYGTKPEAVLKDYCIKDGKYYDMYIFATYRDSDHYKNLPAVLRAETVYAFFPPIESVHQLVKMLVGLNYLPEKYANRKNMPAAQELTSAISQYQQDHNLDVTGEFNAEMIGSFIDKVYPILREQKQ
ncbi:MAG: GNAT family N-acetyltransferase [Candidatus Margulisbacteria bacterium]|nr:GNAT family N-acetyltransferase [Candidatus Margulisiibacteriota bacterium]